MPDSKASFELDSGLPDDYEVVVENAHFGFHEKYRGGDVPLLILSCASPDADMDVRDELFSMGGDWKVVPGGERVEGKEKFKASSWLGRLIVRCSELDMPGFEGGDNGTVLDFIADRGTAQEAHIWVGLRFRMKRETADFGERGIHEHIMPSECLGLMTSADIAAAGGGEQRAGFGDDSGKVDFDETESAEAEQLPPPEPEADKQDDVVLALLRPAAQAADNVVAFQTTVVSSYATSLDSKWLARIMDGPKAEELYEELRKQ